MASDTNNGKENKENEQTMDIEDISDAVTVVNMATQRYNHNYNKNWIVAKIKPLPANVQTNCRTEPVNQNNVRLEQYFPLDPEPDTGTETVKQDSWKLIKRAWLSEDSTSITDLYSEIMRTRVFLLAVDPDPGNDPLNFVSGFCHDGCLELSLFSQIHWVFTENETLPMCPHCKEKEIENRLILMFFVKLRVMDEDGCHKTFHLWRKYAELFLGCTARDYLFDPVVRSSRCQLLRDGLVSMTPRDQKSVMLELSIVLIGDIIVIVDSSLKLPDRRLSDTKL